MKCIHFDGYQNNNNIVLSKCVDLKCTEETGRGLFVSKDVKPGKHDLNFVLYYIIATLLLHVCNYTR